MSEQNIQTPRKALNKAYLKVKPCREQVEIFKRELKKLLRALRPDESEEFNKNHISAFLRETHYKSDYFINTKSRNDLVIHNGNRDKDSVGVLIETKRPGNKAEMPDKNHLNTKAMQELVLYFLDERITAGNDELKNLVAKQADPSADVHALETQIHHLVYQLYNLTPEEIAVVEGGKVTG